MRFHAATQMNSTDWRSRFWIDFATFFASQGTCAPGSKLARGKAPASAHIELTGIPQVLKAAFHRFNDGVDVVHG